MVSSSASGEGSQCWTAFDRDKYRFEVMDMMARRIKVLVQIVYAVTLSLEVTFRL